MRYVLASLPLLWTTSTCALSSADGVPATHLTTDPQSTPDDAAVDGESGADDSKPPGHPWPDSSYDGIYVGLDAFSGADLVAQLCGILHDGYNGVSYTDARTIVLDHVDNHDGQVKTVYEGLWHDASPHSDVNIEHTWPQSKGADEGEARSDLHHLFPERSTFNSARSNLAYGLVVARDWPKALAGDASCADRWAEHADGCFSIKGKDAYGIEVFEPRDGHKGDAARAVFYFSLRYGAGCRVKPLSVFDPDHSAVTEGLLKHWNYADPPDDHERRRNEYVEHTQNVRNPFIDHPELVDRISFQ